MSDTFIIGLALVCLMLVIIGIPCVGVMILGGRMINQVGNFPSKTPVIQLDILLKLIILEVISATMLLLFYHMMTDYTQNIAV